MPCVSGAPRRCPCRLIQPLRQRGHPQHKRIVGHITPHHCPRPNKGIAPNRRATDNRGIGTNRRPASHQGPRILLTAPDLGAWVDHIRKDTRRPTEDIVFEFHPRVDRDVILDLDVMANHHVRRHMHILAQNTAFPNRAPAITWQKCQIFVPAPIVHGSSI